MTTAAAIVIVMAIVQFFKKLLPLFLQGTAAVVLVVLSSVGVTLYKFLSEGIPFGLDAITFLISVIVGSLSAYSLIKLAGGAAKSL